MGLSPKGTLVAGSDYTRNFRPPQKLRGRARAISANVRNDTAGVTSFGGPGAAPRPFMNPSHPEPIPPLAVTIAAGATDCWPAARRLATALGLAVVAAEASELPFLPPFLLVVTPARLELRQTGLKAPGPVFVDFCAGRLDFRRRHGGGRSQPLARAVGLKANRTPTVVDATAGLGRDGFVLACLGCRVTLMERSPVLAALLADGLRRAMADPEIESVVGDRLQLLTGDSRQLLLGMTGAGRPEVVYLDPMYPHRTKSALVKKEMRALRLLVGDDDDAPALLAAALATAGERVVVKRPLKAAAISGPRPTMAIVGKTHRFDVYLVS